MTIPGQIEIRDSTGITVNDNTMSKEIWDRGNAEYVETGTNIDLSFSVASCTDPEVQHLATATDLREDEKIAAVATTIESTPQSVESHEEVSPGAKQVSKHENPSIQTAPELAAEDSFTQRTLLQDIREERLQAFEERLLAKEEWLKAKNERLLFLEHRIIFEKKLERFEQLLKKSEQQFQHSKQSQLQAESISDPQTD